MAAKNGNTEIVKLLLKYQCRINSMSKVYTCTCMLQKLTHLDITPELISGPVITEETKHNFDLMKGEFKYYGF